MKETSQISVIIVSYNYGKYIRRTLQACAEQTYRDFEVIVVDDGSTDETQSVIDEFTKQHPEIKLTEINKAINEGLPKGRNTGLNAASGKYVMFNDSDDWMEPNCLQEMANTIEATHADRIIAVVNLVNKNGVFERTPYSKNLSRWAAPRLQGTVIRRSLFTDNGISFSEGVYHDDFAITCKINAFVEIEALIDKPLHNMYFHPDSMSGHGEGWYIGRTADRIRGSFSDVLPTKAILKTEKDRMLFMYCMIIHYYSCVFDCIPYSYADKLESYRLIHDVMKSIFPDYLHNKNIKLFAENHFAGHFKRNVWVASRCEIIDSFFGGSFMMRLLLFAYHCATKAKLYKSKHERRG